jgi:glycosyltransferase involved in cell wall biosynthesis
MPDEQRSVSAAKGTANLVTVVICAYSKDRWVTLRRAIDATLKQISFDDELLVVIDHNDELLVQCREHGGRFVVLPNRRSRGLSGARNTALGQARGSIVVFLDDDAIPLDGWLDALRAPYADPQVYGVGGRAKPRWLGGRPAWFPEEFLWVVGCSHRGLPSSLGPVRNLIGANMSFRKAAFGHVGGFAEHMGRIGERLHGCEETEFSIRLTKTTPGSVLLYEPSSQVEHHVAARRASLSYFVRRCWAEGLSKAEVSRRVGSARALSAERYYTSRVLPKGIWTGLRDSAAGDLWGAARSAVMVLGLAATAAGYCVGAVCRPAAPADGGSDAARADGCREAS